jgi:hypothetical protein
MTLPADLKIYADKPLGKIPEIYSPATRRSES